MSGLPISNRAATAGAILLGLAIPSLIAGRVPIAVAIALGSLLLAGPAHVRAALAATPELLRQPVAVATGATLTLWLVSAAIAGEAWALQVWAYVAGFLVLACYLYRRLRDDRALRILFFKTTVVGGLISVTLAALSVLVWWEFLNPLRTSHVTSFYEAQQKLLSYGSVLPILSVAAIHAGWRLGRRWLAASLLVLPMGAGILLETGASHRLLEKLEARQLDVIVAAEAGPDADWAEVHPLFREPFVVAAPRGRFQPGPGLRGALLRLPFIPYTSRHMMGRLIDEHLGRHNLALPRRFELDSYHAIMAMVAAGTGWTIITPLGCMAAERFRDGVDIFELPFAPVSRRIVLSARRGVLDDMPGRIAERLRRLLGAHVVPDAHRRMPFLGESLAVLTGPADQVP